MSEGGPSFYVVRRHRVGQRLLRLTCRMLASGALSTTKAARILGVKPPAGREGASAGPWRARIARKTLLLYLLDANVLIELGYAPDLSDEEVERIGRDPFLVAYALSDPARRTVVTTEVSKPKKQRANRHVPDVCTDLGVPCCNTYQFIDVLDFTTGRPSRQVGSLP